MAGNSQLAAAMADGRSQTPYPFPDGWIGHGSQQPILCPCPCPAPSDCGNAQLAAVLSHDRGVTAYEPGDLGVHSNAQVALFRAFPGPRGRLHPSELEAAPVLNRHYRTPQPSGQLAARGAPPGLPSLGQQPVFFLRPEIPVTRFLNPPSRRAGRWGSGLPPMGARRVRHLSFAACSWSPGRVLLHRNVSPLRMSILSPCCCGYFSSNRGEDQADSSSNKRMQEIKRNRFASTLNSQPSNSLQW
jgi:hypothetical protein